MPSPNNSYRAAYEQLRDDLQRRDRLASQDPFTLQRWPMERKAFADSVDQAFERWQAHSQRSQPQASGFPQDATGDDDEQ